ncbi:acylphosphatase [Limnovirga soli]|uniref:acylphosphatase n=1 Tax=Limnovirga soli TaxID=2656915 RepID=A0A8J8FFS0_9BACT|nr:acylphosphatase [Limnovirga soli]NNV57088.1 acylphosphatase [Limnovirga soli]
MIKTVNITVYGKVQGVFYRASAKQMADNLGIQGWVKNTSQGNVAILATGDEFALQQFISWCKQGPSRALVTDVEINYCDTVLITGFTIIR